MKYAIQYFKKISEQMYCMYCYIFAFKKTENMHTISNHGWKTCTEIDRDGEKEGEM